MSLDDARIRFYLKNRKQIDEWAALRAEAGQAIDSWLKDRHPAMETLAQELGPDVVLIVVPEADDGGFLGFRFFRQSWDGSADPPVSISLDWARGKTMFGAFTSPYVGIRAHQKIPIGAALRASEPVKSMRATRKDTTTPWFVAYRYVAPQADFPEFDEQYSVLLCQAIRDAWNAYAPLVDDAVRLSTPTLNPLLTFPMPQNE